jgi:Uma2 family endonuclease
MATTPTRLTIDDFEELPYEQVKNHELIDGGLVDMGSNTPLHNLIRDWLTTELGLFVRKHGLGLVISVRT